MIDLETLSTKCNSSILIIAAIRFNRTDPIIEMKDIPSKDIFYEKVNIQSCKDLKMDISEDTLKWWDEQDKEIKEEAFEGKGSDLKDVLKQFSK